MDSLHHANRSITYYGMMLRTQVEFLCTEVSIHFTNIPPGPANKIISDAIRNINQLSDDMDDAEEELREEYENIECLARQHLMMRDTLHTMLEIKELVLDEIYILQQFCN
ncbi:unnamed protein product [Caenorhabditis angaria]|uniref:Uncharacterized protein n=1 Tax=Caenorhabditis angaria TaxID=860376 RepID=A0A9P1J1B3_9PELO|nr:unnamed protein product [Caenorhabditis angaria]